ncbi:hypothetical protein BCR24_06620 [Enterococcus ureilyticus]|uniref:Conjugal transfer protein n=1 Tax=Enterococcus ureilyticus TaxID=1131292 RepID=A0A1E5H9C5_9ENTE|nr:conjugal transfer protein [Enterococcus ureilyticus]MBM7688442.1 hypothetical protein [Enterococcus ureilyticus]OEG21542.1 hypothetical protein BCR24_06620 [Enterococcus ureilyticus]
MDKYFDYSGGLNAPYLVQELRDKKGRLIWAFTTPVSLSYFVILVLCLTILAVVLTLFPIIDTILLGNAWLLYLFLPHKLARLYVENEIDGKPMHRFLIDFFKFCKEFMLDKREIYQGQRVEIVPEELTFDEVIL